MKDAIIQKFNMDQAWINLGYNFPKDVPFFVYKRRFYFAETDSRGRKTPGHWTVWDKKDRAFPKSFSEEELLKISPQEFKKAMSGYRFYDKPLMILMGIACIPSFAVYLFKDLVILRKYNKLFKKR